MDNDYIIKRYYKVVEYRFRKRSGMIVNREFIYDNLESANIKYGRRLAQLEIPDNIERKEYITIRQIPFEKKSGKRIMMRLIQVEIYRPYYLYAEVINEQRVNIQEGLIANDNDRKKKPELLELFHKRRAELECDLYIPVLDNDSELYTATNPKCDVTVGLIWNEGETENYVLIKQNV